MKTDNLILIIAVITTLTIVSIITINYLISANNITREDLPITIVDVGVEVDTNVIDLKKGESKTVTLYVMAPLDKAVKAELVIEPDMMEGMDVAYKHITITADKYTIDVPVGKGEIVEGRGEAAIRDTIHLTVSVAEDVEEGRYTYTIRLMDGAGIGYGPYLHIDVS